MKTTYLVWKDPSCNGINPDWQEMNGEEFYALVRSQEAKNRHFIKLPSADKGGGDGELVMEVTKNGYLDWKREKNHADYLRNWEKTIKVVSYNSFESENGEFYGEELLPDGDNGVESIYIKTHGLEMALASLTDEERQLIEYFYLSEKQGTVRGYEKLTGISKSTINRRQKAVLEKLKKFFES